MTPRCCCVRETEHYRLFKGLHQAPGLVMIRHIILLDPCSVNIDRNWAHISFTYSQSLRDISGSQPFYLSRPILFLVDRDPGDVAIGWCTWDAPA